MARLTDRGREREREREGEEREREGEERERERGTLHLVAPPTGCERDTLHLVAPCGTLWHLVGCRLYLDAKDYASSTKIINPLLREVSAMISHGPRQ